MKKKTAALALLLLAALLLSACGTQAAPEAPVPESEPLPEGAVEVSTVDELLAAIRPNAVIVLKEGEYRLDDAADYGEEDLRGFYRWELVSGGCQLTLSNVSGLRLIGQGEVSLLAQPRYAAVLCLRECWDVTLENLTLGHTLMAAPCSAGVLSLTGCDNVLLEGCHLFGCGSTGFDAMSCHGLSLHDCLIDGCSNGAFSASYCKDLRLEDCRICDNGLSELGAGNDLIFTERCKGLALVNCEITGNRVNTLLRNYWSSGVALLGCRVEENRFLGFIFQLNGRSVTVDKCSFQRRSSEDYYPRGALFAQNPEGEDLISFDLDHMELAHAEYDGPAPEVLPGSVQTGDGGAEVTAATVDQFLAAIAPDTTIVLEAGEYDLSAASDYGSGGNGYYSWEDCYDGYVLRIENVHGLRIVGAGQDETRILAEPRYAAVLSFLGCEDLGLADFTAGHSPSPAYCTGNVLDFEGCSGVSIERCGLFGCGVLGVWASNCEDLSLSECEIYECSWGAATFTGCSGVFLTGCSIHDCDDGRDLISVYDGFLAWNETILYEGVHRFSGWDYVSTEPLY